MFNKTPEFSFSIITLKKEITVCTGKNQTREDPARRNVNQHVYSGLPTHPT